MDSDPKSSKTGHLQKFGQILDGNTAMAEIWVDLLDRIDKSLPLSSVQQIVAREWVAMARSHVHRLELEAQHAMLPDEKYVELQTLKESIALIENYSHADRKD